jgi:hypothetical protein
MLMLIDNKIYCPMAWELGHLTDTPSHGPIHRRTDRHGYSVQHYTVRVVELDQGEGEIYQNSVGLSVNVERCYMYEHKLMNLNMKKTKIRTVLSSQEKKSTFEMR